MQENQNPPLQLNRMQCSAGFTGLNIIVM